MLIVHHLLRIMDTFKVFENSTRIRHKLAKTKHQYFPKIAIDAKLSAKILTAFP